MITGFNTDVEYDGVVYHVQTEDKGLETPMILTLVYDRGTILARKRQPYEDLFTTGFKEKEVEARLNRQHSLVCAAIKAGRIDELIAMTRRESSRSSDEKKAKKPAKALASQLEMPGPSEAAVDSAPIPKPAAEPSVDTVSVSDDDEPVVEVMNIIEDDFLLPVEAVEIVSHMAGRDRPKHDRLCVEFVNETPFKGGENKTVTFMVCRGSERRVVGNAQIMVKILGSNLRPQIFHSVTDKNGLAKMELELPHFSAGRAAFLVRASIAGEEIEVRRPISQSH